MAENSGHDVVGDEPELVIEAIRSILRLVRKNEAEQALKSAGLQEFRLKAKSE